MDYGSSKATIVHLARSLALHLGPQGIRVNAVAPGFTYTPFLSTMGVTTADLDIYRNTSVLERMAQPGEIAPLYVTATDPQFSFLTGSILSNTGGIPGP
jgi:NAD(P)-dependent dehydrogenase (short-subunit alcohol dehydrogenase family)